MGSLCLVAAVQVSEDAWIIDIGLLLGRPRGHCVEHLAPDLCLQTPSGKYEIALLYLLKEHPFQSSIVVNG
jgi:hypothetical protein